MIGAVIRNIRKQKKMKLVELAEITGIDIGHLSHIEKGERNPSHKALKKICSALEVSYQQLMYTYDKFLSDDQVAYGIVDKISYNRILAVETVSGFVDCPNYATECAVALKMKDDSMEKSIKKGNYAYIAFNTPLENEEIGLFQINEDILIRKFMLIDGNIVLKAENEVYPDIQVNKSDDTFNIIGKVVIN